MAVLEAAADERRSIATNLPPSRMYSAEGLSTGGSVCENIAIKQKPRAVKI
ncbi:MAG: hypothetical protein U0Q16_16100 [Bryobacteraceae bacterium]